MPAAKPRSVLLTPPRRPLSGRVSPPGSKSITNRALLLAALAKGETQLTGALKSDDTGRMAEALAAMGINIMEPDATSFHVVSHGRLAAPATPLFLGNAGTATRFLTAAVASVDGEVIVDGDEHMRKRPIGPLVEALASLGVNITAPTGCPPVTVKGSGAVRGGRVTVDAGLSSQYVSALLMLGPLTDEGLDIVLAGDDIGAKGYIDLTTAAMAHFGAVVDRVSATHWQVRPGGYRAADLLIEPDASAATYLWAAERLTGGAIDIGVKAEAFTQPDALAHRLITAFPDMPAVIDGSQMQDAVPTLAVMAAFNSRPVRFIGIANLRVKECDRIRALSEGLNRVHAGLAEEDGDDLVIHARPSLIGGTTGASIATFSDHRIAMSFALAGLVMAGVTIEDPDCVAKTYPSYWRDVASLGIEMRFA
jgi:3-phosphoshikimate 1-carboxyvinyltransferase